MKASILPVAWAERRWHEYFVNAALPQYLGLA
jgi:hypothetical protein